MRYVFSALILLMLTGCTMAGSGLSGLIALSLLLTLGAACRPLLDENHLDEFLLRYLLREKDSSAGPACTGSQDYTRSFDLSSVDPAASGFGFTISGQNNNDDFGHSVSGAGDFNGDGIGDIIVGASRYNGNRGRAYLLFGRSGTGGDIDTASLTASLGVYFGTTTATHYIGQVDSFSAAGDVNGDGFDDLILGSYYHNSSEGRAYLIFGSASPTSIADLSAITAAEGVIFEGTAGGDYTGASVAGLGDVNGDGLDDFAIGSSEKNGGGLGEASIVFGRTSGWSTPVTVGSANITGTTGFTVLGEASSSLGTSVAPLGDINGDGIHDILIGARAYNTNAGAGYVIYGTNGTRSTIDLATLPLGDAYRISGAGTYQQGRRAGGFQGSVSDFNGDGTADFALGSRSYAADTGRVALLFGDVGTLALSSLTAERGVFLDGPTTNVRAASSLSMGGDVNGDGLVDLLVGAERSSYNGSNSGSAYLVFGQSGINANTTIDTFNDGTNGIRVDGPSANYNAGSSVGLSDVNGDGCADILMSAHGSGTGKVYVIFGGRAR